MYIYIIYIYVYILYIYVYIYIWYVYDMICIWSDSFIRQTEKLMIIVIIMQLPIKVILKTISFRGTNNYFKM